MISEALPWTIGLLGLTTLFSFAVGTFLGALLAWPGAPRWLQWLMPPLVGARTPSRSSCSASC